VGGTWNYERAGEGLLDSVTVGQNAQVGPQGNQDPHDAEKGRKLFYREQGQQREGVRAFKEQKHLLKNVSVKTRFTRKNVHCKNLEVGLGGKQKSKKNTERGGVTWKRIGKMLKNRTVVYIWGYGQWRKELSCRAQNKKQKLNTSRIKGER